MLNGILLVKNATGFDSSSSSSVLLIITRLILIFKALDVTSNFYDFPVFGVWNRSTSESEGIYKILNVLLQKSIINSMQSTILEIITASFHITPLNLMPLCKVEEVLKDVFEEV
jgi:hypothetical protein